MEKLELKHLVPYLIYDLKLVNRYGGVETLSAINISGTLLTNRNDWNNTVRFLPVLRPLSDFHKFNNKEFFNEYELEKIDGETIYVLNYFDCQKLLELHFDIFGLIERGLAVDINTL